MEVKNWSYEEFPEFTESIEGAVCLDTTGDEIGVRCTANVEYANINGTPLHLHVLRPFTRNDPDMLLPCVAFVQGSAWMEQETFVQVPMISKLAERGFVVVSIEYRHSGIAPFPAQALDVRNAIRFLRIHAAEYGIEPDRMVVMGDSSGGHTAMFAGIIHDDGEASNIYPGVSAEVKAIINLYGSCSVMAEDGNPTTINHHMPDSPEGMEMGGINLKEHPELCRKLSVECNIDPDTELVPVLIFQGTKDRTVNITSSVVLYKRLRECGKNVQFYLVRGGDHGGAEYWTDQVLDIEERFIREHI